MIKRWELLYLEIQLLSNEIKGLVIIQGRLVTSIIEKYNPINLVG
jgi:hypothetical protein